MKQTPPPVIQLQAPVCARAGNSALCGSRGERENFTVALCCVHCSSAFPHVLFSTSCRLFFLLVSVHYTFPAFLCHAPVKFSYSLHVIFLVSHLGYFPLTFGFSIYVNLMFFQRSFSVTLNHPQDRSVTGSGYSKKDKSAFFLDSQQELCVL